jgi:DNA recombination protein RmuC
MVIGLLIGLVLGALAAVAAWQLARSRSALEAAPLRAELARLEAERAALEQSDERVRALTAEILERNSEALQRNNSSFLELAETKLSPIRASLDRFDQQTRALEQSRKQAYGELFSQVRTLAEGQERLRSETGNLVKALRAPHVRGRWGELQLKRVVELAGMVAHCDFVEQSTTTDADGRLLRPDLVVKLPGGKNVVVDAKAPLHAYLDSLEAEDEETRRLHLQAHARQVRDHITKLAAKAYWKQFAPAPEFVVMFLPDETFFRAACELDPALHEVGPENGVLVATPTMLIGLLKTIAYGWQQETVAESAREIAALGRELYDRLGVFARHFTKAGRGIETAVGAYNEAVASLETRVLVTARKFEERGAASGELGAPEPIDKRIRPVQAPELTAPVEPVPSPELPAADAA